MAILFCGIVMSHYTHPNLSPVTQITTQQTFRTIAFIAGKTTMFWDVLHKKLPHSYSRPFVMV